MPNVINRRKAVPTLIDSPIAKSIESHLKSHILDERSVKESGEDYILWKFFTMSYVSCIIRLYETGTPGEQYLLIEAAFGSLQIDAFSNVAYSMALENSKFPHPLRLAITEANDLSLCIVQSWLNCKYIPNGEIDLLIPSIIELANQTKIKLKNAVGFNELPSAWFPQIDQQVH